jgi:outer membrane lipoprotein-sorting protein
MIAVALVAALGAPAGADESARQILDREKALEDGPRHWDDRHQKLTLHITGRGAERTREVEVWDRREAGGEQKTVVFLRAPADVKGTAFLSFMHKGRAGEQWLYMPELQRVRALTARTRSESFVGSDLTYRDLDLLQEIPSWSEADASAALRPAETIDGTPTHVIELTPKREDIGYKRIVIWLATDDLVARKLQLFEDGDTPKKVVQQRDVRPVGAIPVAYRMEVETPAAGTRTTVEVTAIEFNQKPADDLFTQRALERGAP